MQIILDERETRLFHLVQEKCQELSFDIPIEKIINPKCSIPPINIKNVTNCYNLISTFAWFICPKTLILLCNEK